MTELPRRILIVALDNLGDAIMATSLYDPLLAAIPDAYVGFWVKEYSAPVLAGLPVDRVHASDPFWDRSPVRGKGSFSDFYHTLTAVRVEEYDTAILLNTEWRRALAAVVARIPRRIGFRRRKSAPFLTDRVKFPSSGHNIDDHRRLLEHAVQRPVPPEQMMPRLTVLDSEADLARRWLAPRGLAPRRYAVVHPFAGDRRRYWGVERWNAFLAEFRRARPDLRIVIVGTARDRSDADAIAASQPGGHAHVFIDQPLPALKGLVAASTVFVGGDSGPSHVAAALATPVVALFAASDPSRFAPRGRGRVEIVKAPGFDHLTPADVLAGVQRAMKGDMELGLSLT